MTISSKNCNMSSKYQISREKTFLNYSTMTYQIQSCPIQKKILGSRLLASSIHCTLKLLELSLIILQQKNTDFTFFLEKNSNVYVDYIQSKYIIIFYITVEGSTRARIWEEKLSFNFHLSWSSTRILFSLEIALYELVI